MRTVKESYKLEKSIPVHIESTVVARVAGDVWVDVLSLEPKRQLPKLLLWSHTNVAATADTVDASYAADAADALDAADAADGADAAYAAADASTAVYSFVPLH